MKNNMYLILFILFVGIVNAKQECSVVEGDGTISSTAWYDQTFQGQTIENISVNITLAAGSNWTNISCVTQKPYGTYTNQTNGSITHNITFCNMGVNVLRKFNSPVFMINQTAAATECNTTFSVKGNSSNTIVIEIVPNENRQSTTGYPLIYIGASAIGGVSMLYLWRKRRS